MGLPTLKTTQVKSGFSFKTLTRVKVEVKESFTGKAEMILRVFPEKRNLDENLVSSDESHPKASRRPKMFIRT